MRLDQEIKELIPRWRPVLGNQDDIDIRNYVNKRKSSDEDMNKLKFLLNKRIKNYDNRGIGAGKVSND